MRDDIPTSDMDLGRLPGIWEGLDKVWNLARQHADANFDLTITDRKTDLAQTSGHRVYTEAWRKIQCAMDNHFALLSLLEYHGVTLWAPWNMLRPSFEAAFYAVWVLEPELSLDRRRRALRLEVIDEMERLKFYEELTHVRGAGGRESADRLAERRAQVTPTYQAEAVLLDLTWQQTKASVNIRDELGRLHIVTNDIGMDTTSFYRATWRSLSGYQHGHGYAAMLGSDITLMAKTPGGRVVRMEVNDENFQSSAQATAYLMISALNLWMRRNTRHD